MFENNPLLVPRKEFDRHSPDYIEYIDKTENGIKVQQLEQPFGFIYCLNLKRQAEFTLMNWLKKNPAFGDAQTLLNYIMLTQDYIFDTTHMELGYAAEIENDSAEKRFEQTKELIINMTRKDKSTPTKSSEKGTIKPVEEYLINGPIPADELAELDLVKNYLDSGIIDTALDVHFMLESISVHGAPKWWKGTAAQFEEEFHNQYHYSNVNVDLDSEYIWRAAEAEVKEHRLSPLPEDETDEQLKNFLLHGKRRWDQSGAVELLLDMWVEAINRSDE